MKLFLKFIAIFYLTMSACSQADQVIGEIFFEGYPVTKFEINGTESTKVALDRSDRLEYKVLITREGDNFYWATRNNLQLYPVTSGVYITYLAVNGAGYVRNFNPEMMRQYNSLPESQEKNEFTYMENMAHQMGSMSYYGR